MKFSILPPVTFFKEQGVGLKKSKKIRSYRKYLRGKKWKKKRFKIMRRDGFECSICGSKKQLEVHHRTYARVKKERDEDLITVCRRCHEKLTFWEDGRKRTEVEAESILNEKLEQVDLIKDLFEM